MLKVKEGSNLYGPYPDCALFKKIIFSQYANIKNLLDLAAFQYYDNVQGEQYREDFLRLNFKREEEF